MKAAALRMLGKSMYIRFSLGGLLLFGFEYLLTFVLTEFVYINHRISYAFSLATGLYILFFYHKNVTFKLKKHTKTMMLRFFGVYILSYSANWLFVLLLTMEMNYLIAIPIVTFMLSFVDFFANKHLVFRK
jgi:putative flippase GtrA